MKRLLSIDGGGIRGVFSLQILLEMERRLRERSGDSNKTLSDHFHYIGGTSTGAIIATCLSWGMDVKTVLDLYLDFGGKMFLKRAFWHRFKTKFDNRGLTAMLQKLFSKDGDGRELVNLGTDQLKTLLLVVTRNSTTGSAWPLTNNPAAKYNAEGSRGNNLLLPLWQIVRASTAAPTFYPPERVVIHGDGAYEKGLECLFEDGGVTPFNNPAYLLFLKATLPEYQLAWEKGRDKMHLVSIGTGLLDLSRDSPNEPHLLETATTLPVALIQAYQENQDLLCRERGETLFGAAIDGEVGDMIRPNPDADFTYVRYNHLFTAKDFANYPTAIPPNLPMDNLSIIPFLSEFGKRYASDFIEDSHLRFS